MGNEMHKILNRLRMGILIIIFLVPLLILTSSVMSVTLAEAHLPIFIEGNDALATFIDDEGLSGNGTSTSPYVIENFIIDVHTVTGILIRHTDAHLIIRDCSITSGGYPTIRIHLFNATNVNISNNYVVSGGFGIVLENANNNSIFSNTNPSIFLNFSGNNILSKNTVKGIQLVESSNNILSENFINNDEHVHPLSGIRLTSSCNNTLSGNNISGNHFGIYLNPGKNNTLTKNIVNNNMEIGIWLYYSDNNTLSGNNASINYSSGIRLSGSNNNTLTRNIAYYNHADGIRLGGSSNNILYQNNASYNNEYGIYLSSGCYENTLSENNVDNNYLGGIYVETPKTESITATISTTTETTKATPSLLFIGTLIAIPIVVKQKRK